MTELAAETCVECRTGAPHLEKQEIERLHLQIPDWRIVEQSSVWQLERQFPFSNFAKALAFTNRVGELADAEGHHPTILTEWGRVTVTLWTHSIGGLHRNDFILAAKVDQLTRLVSP